ncbi:MAG: sensor histidine kinase [Chloroflexi bacterium]|nr:sensor histidine kinase [Chloroflexota bacterium]
MLYVAIGLAAMFVAVYWLSIQTIERATQASFEERLAIAQTVAVALSNEFDHAIRDAVEDTEWLGGSVSASEANAAARAAFEHLSETDYFSFFEIAGVSITSSSGMTAFAGPGGGTVRPARTLPEVVTVAAGGSFGMRVFWDDSSNPGALASLSMPLLDADGIPWGRVLVDTVAISSLDPFIPFGALEIASDPEAPRPELPSVAKYSLEVISPTGKTLLTAGSNATIGQRSAHFDALEGLPERSLGVVMVHRDPDNKRHDHVMAAVPVPRTDLMLVLLQDKDVALALTADFRTELSLYGGIGVMAALLVAWFTTRHVVRSAEELTVAARRMAAGDLDSPIEIDAQDEIGELSESIESMRRQLSSAATERERTQRELEVRVVERTRQLREALRQAISGQEGERQRLARDLHDEVAQELIILTRAIDGVRRRVAVNGGDGLAELEYMEDLARNTLATVRRFSRDLRPSVLDDLGLVPALRWMGADTGDRTGVVVTVIEDGGAPELDPNTTLALFRIAQEALHNIERHAEATAVSITVSGKDGWTSLAVRDDGRGFHAMKRREEYERSGHVGILGMTERAELVGGRLFITSEVGRGTTVTARVPSEVVADGAPALMVGDIDQPAPDG